MFTCIMFGIRNVYTVLSTLLIQNIYLYLIHSIADSKNNIVKKLSYYNIFSTVIATDFFT